MVCGCEFMNVMNLSVLFFIFHAIYVMLVAVYGTQRSYVPALLSHWRYHAMYDYLIHKSLLKPNIKAKKDS